MKRAITIISLFLATATDASINSATIIQDTLAALPNCIHYHAPTHFCVWLGEWGKVTTTPIVSHYLPDLVVTVFNKPEDNPWFEINKIIDNLGQPIQNAIVKSITGFNAGSGQHSLQNQHEQNVFFKEADVIGNPALLVIPAHGLLPSTATPWNPYFLSTTDSLLWRGLPPAALPEEAMALGLSIPHHVGTGFTNWGSIYPHEGKVINDNEVKASAVIAERAADLLTNPNAFTHVRQTLETSCGKHCKAAPIQENSKKTYFQMIYPITQQECHQLGSEKSYHPKMLSHDGAYVWIVWRHYQGCANGDGKYLGRT